MEEGNIMNTTYPLRVRLGVRMQPQAVTDSWYAAGCPQVFDPPVSRLVRLQWAIACRLRGAKRPTTHGKHRRSAWQGFAPVAGLLALLALLLVLTACGGTTAEIVATPETETASEAPSFPPPDYATEEDVEPEPEPEPENTVGEIGDTAEMTQDYGEGAVDGTVTVSAVDVATRPADEWGEKPKNGYFVIFTVDVTAEGPFDVYEDDFYVRDDDGTRYDQGEGNSWDALADLDDMLGYVELNAGEKKTGVIVFDLSELSGELVYAPNSGWDSGPVVSWLFDEEG